MVELEDVPLIGRIAALGGATFDVLLHSGDLVVGLVVMVVGSPDVLVSVLSVLRRFADGIAWLPGGLLEDVVTVLLVALLVQSIATLAKRKLA